MNALIAEYDRSQEILDQRTALICTVLANCFRDSKRKAFKVQDFMPKKQIGKPKDEKPANDPNTTLHLLRLLNASLGGKEVIREK